MARFPYREMIELHSTGMAIAKVAYLCGVGLNKTRDVLHRAQELGVCWPVPSELDDEELEQLVDPLQRFKKHQPDFPAIAEAIGVKKLRRKYLDAAYEAYLQMAREAGGDPYSRLTFNMHMQKWAAVAHPSITMRINWHAGEEVQADWAGRTLTIVSADNVKAPAYLFVATLPFSDLTFVRASLDMSMQSWLEHHVRMFEYFGGVPIFCAIDNLATGVTFDKDHVRTVNRHYQDLADHYGTIVVPARVEAPRDKAAVEGHVRIMANAIVGILEGIRFTSIEQMNETISVLLEVFNGRRSGALHGLSRREAFEAWERAALQPLPEVPYSAVTWRKYRVNVGDVVRVRGNYYAMPAGFEKETVYVRVSSTRIDVYDIGKRQCLASHPRREDGEETLEGLPATSPDRFRALDDWARANGREKIVAQWDREKNGGLVPERIVCRSKKDVWWRCPDCGHSWKEAPIRRMKRSFDDCPRCSGIALIAGVNDLATTHPRIAAEWDEERNPIPASAVFADWHQRMWWVGSCGHSWCAPIAERTKSAHGALCPYCSGKKVLPGFNDVATLAPELAELWHPTKNGIATPENTSVCTRFSVYLWGGMMSRIWRDTPRAWLKRHGMAEVTETFDRRVRLACTRDKAHPPGPSHSKKLGKARATWKWQLFKSEVDLRLSLREWCERFGHPELLEQWNAQRNAPLTPDTVTCAWRKQVWWTDAACGHSWLETVRNRAYDDEGCIYCGRRRVLAGFSSVERLSPGLLKMWHPTLNEPLTPETVSDRSHASIWWQCPVCGYEWREAMRKTNRASRLCPACEKRPQYLQPGRNNLAGVRPSLVDMVDPMLNEGVDPESLRPHMKRRIWWRGECGHVWQARVDNMVSVKRENACPYCSGRKLLRGLNDLETVAPRVAAMWHPELNGPLKPDCVRASSAELAWWAGECGHVWQMGVDRMAAGGGCPYCKGRRLLPGDNDLATQFPEIARQWHPVLNGALEPGGVRGNSSVVVWWVCEHGHAWQRAVNLRTMRKDTGCPVCANRVVVRGVNDLATTHRRLARQWNKERNGALSARDVAANSSKRVWWRCRHGHEWQAIVKSRTRDHDPGCPYCANRKVWPGFNDLATLRPDLAAQWYWPGNWGLTPRDVMPGSTRKVWWQGSCGHVFELNVDQRARNKTLSCPYCSGRKKLERPMR